MFFGNYIFTVDGKWRISIPAPHREYLLANFNNRLTLTKHLLHNSIMIWPSTVYESFILSFNNLPAWDDGVEKLRHFFISWAFNQEFDGNGRLFIPVALREHAGLSKDVVVVGAGKTMQIWSKDRWEERNREISGNTEELRQLAKTYNILL